jgi:hypothetical protein
MRFRKTIALPKEQGLGHIGAGESIAIELGGAHEVSVEIREAPREEKDLLAVLIAHSQFEPSVRVAALLECPSARTHP